MYNVYEVYPVSTTEEFLTKRWHRDWRMLPILLLILSLGVSLATRTFRLKVQDQVSVKSSSVQAMRQHMDRDAVRRVPPVLVSFNLDAPSFYPHVAPAGPPLPVLLFDKSL